MVEEKKTENKPTGEKKETAKSSEEKPRGRRYSSGDDKGRSRSRGYRSKSSYFFRKKSCFFCKNKDIAIDYKDVNLMRRYIAESGKISPRRFTGTCAKHQRKLSTEIKKARQMALISFTDK